MHEQMAGGSIAAGWYPDPHVAGTLRYWDGAAWSEHTAAGYDHAAPAGPSSGSPFTPGFGGVQTGYRPMVRKRSFLQANAQSLVAIGVAVVYLVLAMTAGIVMLGIIPFMAGIRAVGQKEPLAPLAMLVAIGSIAFGIMTAVG